MAARSVASPILRLAGIAFAAGVLLAASLLLPAAASRDPDQPATASVGPTGPGRLYLPLVMGKPLPVVPLTPFD